MVKFYESSFLYLLPEHLSHKAEVKALAYAINRQIRRLIAYCEGIKLYANIDRLDGNILDVLASELNTLFYSKDLDIEIKRKLIKNTLLWRKKIGTTGAVEDVIKTVFGDGAVEEWYEYDGEPSHFKITTGNLLRDRDIHYLKEVIEKAKNIRSVLDSVETGRTIAGNIKVGSFFVSIVQAPDIA